MLARAAIVVDLLAVLLGCFCHDSILLAQQPTCTTPPANMVGWWPGDGNANDIISSNNGTLVGGVTFAPGEVAEAFSFDGSTGYINATDSGKLDISGPLTVDAWIFR
jgi:hypothetical protein